MNESNLPADVSTFLVVKHEFDDEMAQELWSLLSSDERAGLHEGAVAWKAFMATHPRHWPALEIPHEVRLYLLYKVWGKSADTDHDRRKNHASAVLSWRRYDEQKRKELETRAQEWYYGEYEKRGGWRHYNKPRWMRFMLALGFSE